MREEVRIEFKIIEGDNTSIVERDEEVHFIYVENEEQKRYGQYLRDEEGLGTTTINTFLRGMKRYKEWRDEVMSR
ncbi:hypothetical protein [Haloferax sp. Q22]|uniref:hypothetical protein n=1 Tax=Haloferax sp. (strain Q22) TaxID=1526048 RepID=UPI000737C54F|nr:hypothetical protein [Haloferax sp. Q22]